VTANESILGLAKAMSFDEFQNLARLHVLGALDADEESAFQEGRKEFGEEAEKFLHELLARIRATAHERPKRRWFH
jgi:hypothetical protein